MKLHGEGHERRAERPLAGICLAFSLPIFAAVYVMTGWQSLLLGALSFYIGLITCFRRRRYAGILCLAFTAGLWFSWCWQSDVSRLTAQWEGQEVTLTVRALDYAQETLYGLELEAEVRTEGTLEGETLLLYLNGFRDEISPGDEVTAEVTLASAQSSQPKWRFYHYANGIFLTGSAREAELVRKATPWQLFPRVWVHELALSLNRLFPEETAGFLLALTTGERSALSAGLQEELSSTGLSHVTAASGLHLNLLFSALFLLPGSRRKKGLFLLPALLAFAALAGFTPSICRAAVMQAILLLGPVLDREEDGLTSLALALALILLNNPYGAASVSLQLSFAAMLGLLVVCPALRRRTEGKKTGRLRRSLMTTLGANVFTIPLVLYYFRQASLIAPLSNLVLLWLLPLLLPLAMICALAGWLWPGLGILLAPPVGWLTGLVLELIHLLAQFPYAVLPGDSPVFLSWVVLAYVVGGLILSGHCRGRRAKLAGVLLAFTLAGCFWTAGLKGDRSTLEISLLDVGQGQCILITSADQTAVIDCGSSNRDSAAILEEALSDRNRKTVDLLILTHYDSDHVNGVSQLLSDCEVGSLVAPMPEAALARAEDLSRQAGQMGTQISFLSTAQTLELCNARFTLLPSGAGENRGLAALVSQGDFDLLVTGDLNLQAEEALVEGEALPLVEVLVAGHHGSKYASGEVLLQETQPQAVLFSVGNNGYGHPTQEAIDRCLAAGASIFRTDLNGSLTIQVWES